MSVSGFDFLLYRDVGFRGLVLHAHRSSDFCMPLPVPCGLDFNANLHLQGAGDIVSSVIVRAGYLALYQHENFGGRVLYLGPGEMRANLLLEDWSDNISSWIAWNEPFDPRRDMLDIRRELALATR